MSKSQESAISVVLGILGIAMLAIYFIKREPFQAIETGQLTVWYFALLGLALFFVCFSFFWQGHRNATGRARLGEIFLLAPLFILGSVSLQPLLNQSLALVVAATLAIVSRFLGERVTG